MPHIIMKIVTTFDTREGAMTRIYESLNSLLGITSDL